MPFYDSRGLELSSVHLPHSSTGMFMCPYRFLPHPLNSLNFLGMCGKFLPLIAGVYKTLKLLTPFKEIWSFRVSFSMSLSSSCLGFPLVE